MKKQTVSSIRQDTPLSTSGARIRHARLQMNLSIRELAVRVGVTSQTISIAERNVCPPKIGTVRKLAKVLKQPIWYVGCYENMSENTLGEKIKKARHYHGLTKVEAGIRLGVNSKTILQWESDIHKPKRLGLILENFIKILGHKNNS
ncbi:helix-turn-helix domain-containing protein [Paenibacillus polymyxa]|uniref:helix-turn-helix domain-containing protein n=1 Tax=Paenibacillus polymyxa TaxID=1406 RepID=UPI00211D2251|nr:helix-turn-helix domain-containing protein [Paenibacillus polymyxa]